MSTPESKVRDPVVKWAKRQGFLHFRMAFRVGVKQGVPDDLFIAPGGIHVWVEFKAPTKEPTPLQQHRIATLMDAGAMVFWTNDAQAGINALQRVLNMATLLSAQGGGVPS